MSLPVHPGSQHHRRAQDFVLNQGIQGCLFCAKNRAAEQVFQILAEARLVPGILLPNASLKFVCRDVHLRVESQASLFTRGCAPGSVLRVPVAHHDGNYFADAATLDAMEAAGQIAFRYCRPDGTVTPDASPNGASRNIAGVFNARRNVLGMMPHPENAIDPRLGSTDGRKIFDALEETVAR